MSLYKDRYQYHPDKLIMNAVKHISYNPKTGEIKRIDKKNANGSFDKDGYLVLKIKGRQFKSHRLAWAKYYNHPPKNNIDHINNNRTDNRICNLRCVPQSVNVKNTRRKPNPKTGVIGVYEDSCTKGLKKKFTTKTNGQTHRFYTLNEAIAFRVKNGMQV